MFWNIASECTIMVPQEMWYAANLNKYSQHL